VVAPKCQGPVLFALWLGKTRGKRILQGRELRLVVICREKNWIRSAECGARILIVRSGAKSVINARSTAQHAPRVERPGKSHTGGYVVAIRWNTAAQTALLREQSGADQLRRCQLVVIQPVRQIH